MRSNLTLVCAAAGIALAWGWSAMAAEPKAAPPVQPPATADVTQDVRPDVAKFKGFIGGGLVSSSDTGLVLKVKSVTVVEGSQGEENPGALVGKQITLAFAMEKDAAGKEKPAKWLADAAQTIRKMPWLGGLGGFAAPQQMVIHMGDGGGGGVAIAGGTVTATTVVVGGGGTVTAGGAGGPQVQFQAPRVHGEMTIVAPDGGGIELVLPENDDEAEAGQAVEKDPAKMLPRLLVRAQADEKGTLVVDRMVPGSQTGHEWSAIPKIRVQAPPKADPQAVPKGPPRKATTDF